jgi:hypothetical protein
MVTSDGHLFVARLNGASVLMDGFTESTNVVYAVHARPHGRLRGPARIDAAPVGLGADAPVLAHRRSTSQAATAP